MARISSDATVFTLSRNDVAVCRVRSGDEIVLETRDCFNNQVTRPEDRLDAIDWERINPATGPVYVDGAHPGDVLSVRVERIETASRGIVATGPGFGVLGDTVGDLRWWLASIVADEVLLPIGVRLPARPMIGVIGVAPAGDAVPTGAPGPHGGNMDTGLIAEGATLHLPVFAEGALLSVGDLHAAMGDGEIGITGVEVAGLVTLRPRVRDDLKLRSPLVENDELVATIASDESLDTAARHATADMAALLTSRLGLSRTDAIMLMSVGGNLQVSQVVDPLKTARFVMPKTVLEQAGGALI